MTTRVSFPFFRSTRAFAMLAAIALAGATLAPTVADARLGGGGSFGSRGGRTFSTPFATPTAPRTSPIQRSQTAAPFNGASSFGGARPGFFGGGGFGRGLLGGFLGAGLFGMLFGGGFTGGLGGGFSLIGLILQIGLLYLAFRFIMGFFRNRQPAFGGSGGGSLFGGTPLGNGAAPSPGPARPTGVPITIGPDDYQAFERCLVDSQAAYSNGDVATLRRLATVEMAGNFEQELSGNQRQGVVNRISDVHLVSGDLSEAWREGSSDYATVAMRFSLVDVTLDQRSNQIVSGNANTPQNVTEVWTFTRPTGAGAQAWVLSAIQQA